MASYLDARVQDLLDRFAAPDPVPGGGSAAALAASLGVSLLMMVGRMSKTRSGASEDAATLAAAAGRLADTRDSLIALVDDDSHAYEELIGAYRQPRGTDEARATRDEAIQRSLRRATEVPLETMRLCEQALRESRTILALGNPNAATDAEVGTRLVAAALGSAGLNVDTNVPGITDAAFARRVLEERREIEARAGEMAGRNR